MKNENKRNYPRVNTLLPFGARRLDLKKETGLQCRVSKGGIVIDESPPLPVQDERLDAWLNMLNIKLDYLIRLAPSHADTDASIAFEPVNISGNGLMMVTNDTFQIGDIMEINMVLQAYPAKTLYLYGKVIRIDKAPHLPDMHTVGIKFIGMTEEVRNEILKFEFKKHGETLLKKKSLAP
jgi:Tfp pilus assembly protein PilZ